MEFIEPSDSDVRTLIKFMQASFTIECVPCGHEETVTATGEWAAGQMFARGGWIVVENEAWCDECAESDTAAAALPKQEKGVNQ